MVPVTLLLVASTSFVLPPPPQHTARLPQSLNTANRAANALCCQPSPEKPQLLGRLVGFAYLGNFITVVSIGVLSRLGLVSLPPVNQLTDIANNAMDEAIAAGSVQPLLATGWAVNFWLDLWRQYYAFDGGGPSFVADYCAQHASICAGVPF